MRKHPTTAEATVGFDGSWQDQYTSIPDHIPENNAYRVKRAQTGNRWLVVQGDAVMQSCYSPDSASMLCKQMNRAFEAGRCSILHPECWATVSPRYVQSGRGQS